MAQALHCPPHLARTASVDVPGLACWAGTYALLCVAAVFCETGAALRGPAPPEQRKQTLPPLTGLANLPGPP